jgi:hypothetical protein
MGCVVASYQVSITLTAFFSSVSFPSVSFPFLPHWCAAPLATTPLLPLLVSIAHHHRCTTAAGGEGRGGGCTTVAGGKGRGGGGGVLPLYMFLSGVRLPITSSICSSLVCVTPFPPPRCSRFLPRSPTTTCCTCVGGWGGEGVVGGYPSTSAPFATRQFHTFAPSALFCTDASASSTLLDGGREEGGAVWSMRECVCVSVCVSTNRTGPSASPPLYVCCEGRQFRIP